MQMKASSLGLGVSLTLFHFVFLLPLFRRKQNIVLFCFSFTFFFCSENHVCLSRGVQVIGTAWRAVMRTMAGVGDLVQRIGDGRTGQVVSGRAVGRSGGAVCGLHLARGD
jgi:hypothetical protein